MLHIILTILKIIGIVILVLLALILFCVGVILFVPVRYRVNGKRDAENYFVNVRCYWLLHLLRMRVTYPKPGRMVVKLLCFTIYDSGREKTKTKKPKKKKAVKEQKAEAGSEGAREEKNGEKAVSQTKTEADRQNNIPIFEKEEPADREAEKEDSPETGVVKRFVEKIKAIIQRVLETVKNIGYTIRRICDKIKEIWANLQYYAEVFQEEETKRAFLLCKQQLYKIWKNIRPSRCRADCKIGTGEPDTTGYILALHGIFYPLIGNTVFIEPDFENKVFEGTFDIKGRITLFVLLKVVWTLYFDNDIRYFLKRFKREEITDGRK